MNLRFLCANHRQWLDADLNRSEQHWFEWMEAGSNCLETGEIKEAIPFFGCAFEIAENLLTHSWPTADHAISRFTLSSVCLVHAYEEIAEHAIREYLIVQANCRLARELPESEKYPYVAQCMQSLYGMELAHELVDYCTSIGLSNPLDGRSLLFN